MELNKAVIDCMRSLRRRLRDEQQLDIHLNQPDAVSAMLAGCMRSNDELTRELGRQLATFSEQLPAPAPVPPSPSSSSTTVRIYRGQRVLA
ncbi:hypothetical protein CXK93_05355 [Stutzerimonas decontaminans]|uniref:Uncharacterized protein n=2 Tax=Stutzerimonas TaxID=2901164 RepID=A0ABX4W3L8_9GAMM|nr:hypothetical protein [Stutzerimonas decontaminans]AHY41951.1 hypothetical protein UIB01_05440 [Stutzerimonas decontaminans]MCQ4244228.1 hypothetical protein [Stutzerimonas decontaminans]MCW8154673.1 hypothetical protein [Stutzerimonas stutzeri]PNF86226.1 hypothetical protein CXK93_05355 [Stutzerimonas decontaminans]